MRSPLTLAAAAGAALLLALPAADPAWSAAGERGPIERGEDGKSYLEDGTPTYHVGEDGTVDWYVYNGFRRYHSECHVCHGPDGLGSSFAPSLVRSLHRLDYYEFMDVVVNGRERANSVMPSFGDNLNVMCYIDDLYVYLMARADDAVPRARPTKREDKPDAARQDEDACFGR